MTSWMFVGGDVSLDFVNTAGGRTRQRDVERLTGFADAVGWAHAAGVLDDAERTGLLAAAERDPTVAQRAVTELRAQREALYTFLVAGIEQTDCPETVRRTVQSGLAAAYRQAVLTPQDGWQTDPGQAGLRVIAVRLALATGALLAGAERTQVSRCGRCTWLFIDPSPTRRRRWCSMAVCGNRAKVARHQRK